MSCIALALCVCVCVAVYAIDVAEAVFLSGIWSRVYIIGIYTGMDILELAVAYVSGVYAI